MLSSILNSERAIQVTIQIMRVFSRIRHMLETHTKLKKKIEEMERKYDGQFKIVFDALRELLAPPAPKPKGPIVLISINSKIENEDCTNFPIYDLSMKNQCGFQSS